MRSSHAGMASAARILAALAAGFAGAETGDRASGRLAPQEPSVLFSSDGECLGEIVDGSASEPCAYLNAARLLAVAEVAAPNPEAKTRGHQAGAEALGCGWWWGV